MQTTRTLLVILSIAALGAGCGNKNKKATTVPTDNGSGTGDSTAGDTSANTQPTNTNANDPNLQDVIYFEFDKSDLDDAAKAKLQENADWMKADPKRIITIEGHTDEVGTPEYNIGLGERRARASKEYLVRLGVDASRVSIISYGEERPASNVDAKNRRSVFVATKKKAPAPGGQAP